MKKEITWVVVMLPNPHMGDPSNRCLRVPRSYGFFYCLCNCRFDCCEGATFRFENEPSFYVLESIVKGVSRVFIL